MEADNRDEGPRLAAAAREAGIPLLLFGGVAVSVLCPSAAQPPLRRDYGDVDFATLSGRNSAVTEFFAGQGYEADRLFNALHGATRLSFAGGGRTIDVIVDRFIECHTIDLRAALRSAQGSTIPLPELLLTKLQIVEVNAKDVRDICAMLIDRPPGSEGGVDIQRIADIASDDWGLEHTIRRTLARLAEAGRGLGLDEGAAAQVEKAADAVVKAMDAAPKSLRWRSRAVIGERLRWYQLPEEPRR